MARILVVDDDRSIRRVLRRMFEREGHTVVEADTGAEALEMVDGPPAADAIVCDVMMPQMGGVEFYGALVERAPRLARRVVFLTGSSHAETVNRIEGLGVPLLAKLNDLQLVADAIRVALIRPATA